MSSILKKENFKKEREEGTAYRKDFTVMDFKTGEVTHKRIDGEPCAHRYNEYRAGSFVLNRCRLNNERCIFPTKNEKTCTIPKH